MSEPADDLNTRLTNVIPISTEGRATEIFGYVNAELSYLGACLVNTELLGDSNLVGDDFDRPIYGLIFDRMKERHAAGKGVSQMLMLEEFPKQADIIFGATDYVSELHQGLDLEDAIRDASVRRRVLAAVGRIAEMTKHSGPVDEITDVARKTLDEALNQHQIRSTSMKNDIHQVLAEYRKAVRVVPSPWMRLNDCIGGFAPGRMYVIAARPGLGKSSIATQAAYRLAEEGTVVFSTLEMSKGEVYTRILAQQANTYYPKSSAIPDYVLRQEAEWMDEHLRDIRVLDDAKQTIASIRAAARTAMREGHLAGIVVDYIQLLTVTSKVDGEVARITELTRELKLMSKDFQCPVIALSQLNRAVADRTTGIPGLQDLRGSGSIEQDADVVMFLYRVNDDDTSVLSAFLAKNRNGKAFEHFDLHWDGSFFRATDHRPDPYGDQYVPGGD